MTRSDEDMKKWHIDRTQTFLQSIIEELDTDKTQFRSRTELVENEFTTWRNAILAAASFVASIILGLSSLLKDLTLPTLIADVLIGLIAFIVFSFIKGKVHDHILRTDALYLEAISKLNLVKGYAISQTYNLDEISGGKMDFFFSYSLLAAAAVRVKLVDRYESMLKSMFLRKIQEELKRDLEKAKKHLEVGEIVYQSIKSSWSDYSDDLEFFSAIHNPFLNYLEVQKRDKQEKRG
jgi:hypothetical protein